MSNNQTYQDPATGVYWDSYGRYYDAATGQWLSATSTASSAASYYPTTTTSSPTSSYSSYLPTSSGASQGGVISVGCTYPGCTARCRTNVELARHYREQHVEGFRFYCDDCSPEPKGFKRRDQLNNHQRVTGHARRTELPPSSQ